MTDVAATAEAGAEPAIEQEAPKGRDYEGEARKSGWTPKDEWKGDPDDWKTARQFVEYGEEKAEYDARIERLEKSNRKAEQVLKRQRDEKLASLKAQRAAVVEKGGKGAAEAVEQIDEKIEELKAEGKEDDKPARDDDEASAVADWQRANAWFGTNEEMTKYAQAYANGLPPSDPADVRRKVDRKMRAEFPDYEWDKKPAPKTAGANGHAPVDGGGLGRGKGGKTADDLPAEARLAADRFIKQGLYKTRAEYAKDYFNEQ